MVGKSYCRGNAAFVLRQTYKTMGGQATLDVSRFHMFDVKWLIPISLLIAVVLVYRLAFKHDEPAPQATDTAAGADTTLSERERRVMEILARAHRVAVSRNDLQHELGCTFFQMGFALTSLASRGYIEPVTNYLLNAWTVLGDTRVRLSAYGLQCADRQGMLSSH